MSRTILLVDDDNRLRDLLKDYLNEKNLQVFTCEDFIEAKISSISTSPEREDTILIENPFN